MLSTPVQMGIPGSMELMIVVLVFFLFLAIPALAIALVIKFLTGNGVDEERVAELEREVAKLREKRETTGESDGELE